MPRQAHTKGRKTNACEKTVFHYIRDAGKGRHGAHRRAGGGAGRFLRDGAQGSGGAGPAGKAAAHPRRRGASAAGSHRRSHGGVCVAFHPERAAHGGKAAHRPAGRRHGGGGPGGGAGLRQHQPGAGPGAGRPVPAADGGDKLHPERAAPGGHGARALPHRNRAHERHGPHHRRPRWPRHARTGVRGTSAPW